MSTAFLWWLLIALLWFGIGLFVGIVIGQGAALADEIEQPDPQREAMRRHPSGRLCRCGHTTEAHQHYRAGSDCAACDCQAFRPGAVAA